MTRQELLNDNAPSSSPWGQVQHSEQIISGIWAVSTSTHGGIWLSPDRLAELTNILGYSYSTFCGSTCWFEEDCDWCIPAIAFQFHGSYEAACQQLRGMSQWLENDRYKKAYDALMNAGRIMEGAGQ